MITVAEQDIEKQYSHFIFVKDHLVDLDALKETLCEVSSDKFSDKFDGLTELEKEVFMMGMLNKKGLDEAALYQDIRANLLKYTDPLRDIKTRNANGETLFCNSTFERCVEYSSRPNGYLV